MVISRGITSHPWTVVIAIFAITLFLGASIKTVSTTSETTAYLPDTREVDAFRDIQKDYGTAQYGVIIIESSNGDVLSRKVLIDTLRLEWAIENDSEFPEYFVYKNSRGNVMGIVDIIAGIFGYLMDNPEMTREEIYRNMTEPWSPWVITMNNWFSVLKNMGYLDGWENVTYFNGDCVRATIYLIYEIAPKLKEEKGIDLKIPPELKSYISKLLSNDFNPNVDNFIDIKAKDMAVMVMFNNSMPQKDLIYIESRMEKFVTEDFKTDSFTTRFFAPKLISRDINKSAENAMKTLIPIAILVIIIILLYSFRNITDTVLSLMALAMALVWMYGLANLLDLTMTTIAVAAPILLIGLGIDYAIHTLQHYRDELYNGYRVKEAIERTIGSVGVAILLSTVTTVAGFLSNIFASIPAIVDFGIMCAVGIMSSFIISNTFLPAVKYIIDGWREKRGKEIVKKKDVKRKKKEKKNIIFTAGAVAARKSPWSVIAIAMVITLIMAYFATFLTFEFDDREFLPRDMPITETIEYMDENFEISTEYVSILITGDMTDPGMLLSINETVKNMADDKYVLKPDGVPQAASIVSYMKSYYASTPSSAFKLLYEKSDTLEDDLIPDDNLRVIYQFIYEDSRARNGMRTYLKCNTHAGIIPDFLRSYARRQGANTTFLEVYGTIGHIPDDWIRNETVNRLLEIVINDPDAFSLLKQYIAGEEVSYPGGVINVFVMKTKTNEEYELWMEIKKDTETSSRVDVLPLSDQAKDVVVTNGPVLNSIVMNGIQENQRNSIILMIIIAFVILSIVYHYYARSSILGVITTMPIMFVVAWIMGTLYLLGYSINVMTTMIASLTVGLGIDYSIHVSQGFIDHLSVLRDRFRAMNLTAGTIGMSLMGASTTTVGGFLILTLAPLPPMQAFGLLTAITIVYSIIAALYVLPSMLIVWARNKEDIFAVDDFGLKYIQYTCRKCHRPFVLRMAEKKDDVICPYCGGRAKFDEVINIKAIESMVAPKLYSINYRCSRCGTAFEMKSTAIRQNVKCPKCGSTAVLMKDPYGRPMARLLSAMPMMPSMSYVYTSYYPQAYYYNTYQHYQPWMYQFPGNYGNMRRYR